MLTVRFERLKLCAGSRFLDLGCGEGRHVSNAYLMDGVHSVAVDLDPANVEKTADFLKGMDAAGMGKGAGWEAMVADAENLPFPEGHFKAVVCSEVMEHVLDNKKAAQEIFRVTAPGGVAAVSVPRWFPERICWALSEEYHTNPGGHIRIYRKDGLKSLMESTGLVYKGHHYAHALHAPYWWLKCLVGVRDDKALPVALYHKMLVWDIVQKPRLTRVLDRLLNPVIGKSLVMYFEKPAC